MGVRVRIPLGLFVEIAVAIDFPLVKGQRVRLNRPHAVFMPSATTFTIRSGTRLVLVTSDDGVEYKALCDKWGALMPGTQARLDVGPFTIVITVPLCDLDWADGVES